MIQAEGFNCTSVCVQVGTTLRPAESVYQQRTDLEACDKFIACSAHTLERECGG